MSHPTCSTFSKAHHHPPYSLEDLLLLVGVAGVLHVHEVGVVPVLLVVGEGGAVAEAIVTHLVVTDLIKQGLLVGWSTKHYAF